MSNQPLALKFLMIGDAGVGKTSLVHSAREKKFNPNIDSTVGIEFSVLPMNVNGQNVNIQLWDTAGQEVYRSLSRSYYRDAIGVLLIFSFTDHLSFEHLDNWVKDVKNLCHPKARILLIGNKVDLTEEKQVTNVEIQQFAETRNLEFIETSAKTNVNVTEAFFKIAQIVMTGIQTNEIQLSTQNEVNIKNLQEPEKSKCNC